MTGLNIVNKRQKRSDQIKQYPIRHLQIQSKRMRNTYYAAATTFLFKRKKEDPVSETLKIEL